MKNLFILAVLTALFILPSDNLEAKKQVKHQKRIKKYALIKDAFIPIFKERKPESQILQQASKGQKYRIKRIGKYWVEVYVPPNNETGWIERGLENPKIEIITEKDALYKYQNLIYAGIIILILATIIFFIKMLIESKRKKILNTIEKDKT